MDECSIEQPNVILIMTDSQGVQLAGSYGHGIVDTPRLDELADAGVRFERAYNACPLCTPARAALFTGQAPQVAGAWANDLPVGAGIATMGDYFSAAGYESAYIGKWHLDGTDYFGAGTAPSGWNPSWWFDGRNYLATLSSDERRLWRTGLQDAAAIHEHDITREWTWAGGITDRAVEFLSRRHDRPFLLVASYDEPHGPSVCPPPFCDMYADRPYPVPTSYSDTLRDKPTHHREWAGRQARDPKARTISQPLYLGATSFVDDEIGRILDAADRDYAHNTIVVFTSDHGHYMGAHRLDGKGPALYEEVLRIPLIVRLPGGSDAGTVVTDPVRHLDLLPTLMSLCGPAVPPAMHGTPIFERVAKNPLAPRVRGPNHHPGEDQSPAGANSARIVRGSAREYICAGFDRFSISHDSWFGLIPIRAIVGKRYKLVVNLHQTDELYDLSEDPHETTNRIADDSLRGVRQQLLGELADEMDRVRDPFRGPHWLDREWREASVPAWVTGSRRPRPDDGRREASLHYDTGLPAQSDEPVTVDTGFPGGNILVESVDGAQVVVRQVVGQSMEWWFHWAFRVGNLSGRELSVSFSNGEVVGPHGPAVSLDGVSWEWATGVTGHTATSFTCRLPDWVTSAWFAVAPLYQLHHFNRFVERYEHHPAVVRCSLGRTAGGRDVPVLRLGNPTASRHLLLTARHHACEAPASYELEGLCEELLSKNSVLLSSHLIHVVPFVDLDGVEEGDQGKFRYPYDHNRAYREGTRYPEIAAIMQYRKSLAIEVYLDLHAPFHSGGRHDHSHFVLKGDPWDTSSRRISDLLAKETRAAGCGIVHEPEWDLPFGVEWNTGELSDVSATGSLQLSELARPEAERTLLTAVTVELPYFGPDEEQVVTPESARCFGRSLARALEGAVE